MTMAYLFLLLFLATMTTIYFLPYRKLRGKIFTKLFWNAPSSLNGIRYKDKVFFVEYERDGSAWQVVEPSRWRANNSKLLKLVVKLSEIDVLDRITNGINDGTYDVGRQGELILTYGRKNYTVLLGRKVDTTPNSTDDSMYINKSTDKDVLIISSTILNFLPKSVDDFKDMRLFDALYSEVTSIEAMFNGNTFMMTKVENGWIKKGQMVFEHDARPFVESILLLDALRIAPHGTKLPAKPDGFVIMKVRGKAVTRYLFPIENDDENFLMPVYGDALVVPKSIMDTIFSF